MPIQRLFLIPCVAEGHQVHVADVQDVCAHAKAHGIKTHMRADNACVEWAQEVLGKEIKRGLTMEILHSFQGCPLRGEQ